MTHTPECIKAFKQHAQDMQAFEAQFPNYCRECGATGTVHWSENQAPFGSGECWLMDMADICSCLADGKCPRCGEQTMTAENDDIPEQCLKCGWNNKSEGCPVSPECYCWEKDPGDYHE